MITLVGISMLRAAARPLAAYRFIRRFAGRLVGGAACMAALGATGCNVGEGIGTFAGTLYLRGCTENGDFGSLGAPAPFDLKPTFFVAAPVDDFPEDIHPMNKLS